MRNLTTLNQWRKPHPVNGDMGDETCGHFIIPNKTGYYIIIASGGDLPEAGGFEHVSVHCRDVQNHGPFGETVNQRTPTWDEMCIIKELFFRDDDVCIQFHPAKSNYVNTHKHVLHLWRDTQGTRMPPLICV